ncbi:H-NS histone family protein (plasmid) [Serratia ureilytica]|uniref:H-NS family histone-like protein n=1 Tax=Serratia TaxID=613 RepID=UPI000B605FE3|nr:MULTISPECIES: H-NS family nucleoid-associated regulatory protein [Serratia]ASL96041.1 DNA-binding protein [Serratia marcescens]EBR7327591.1 DNA-binding protein [Salmonella enterica]MDP0522311.1 H-NS family nucleoid-associated regulatory protein [Serratia marcescens]UNE46538.1 H-NS histone family protein [Serratia ureilytica]
MSENDTYTKVRGLLSNIRSVRAFARETDFDLLVEMQEKLNIVIEERREEAEREKKERAERETKRLELLQLIQSEGFDPSELLGIESSGGSSKKSKTGVKRAPKYQYEQDGAMHYWSGVGRKPRPIQDALDQGKSLDSFLIPSQNQ